MKQWVTDELVRSIIRQCKCGGNCGCGAIWPVSPTGETDPRLARSGRSSVQRPTRPRKTPALRLVPNCGSLLKACDPQPPSAA